LALRRRALRARPSGGYGLLTYDTQRDRGHFLNRSATLIWQRCDGQTSLSELVTLLRKQDLPADEEVVWLALDRLGKAHLLQERVPPPIAGISRRAVIRKLALAGSVTVLLPVVTSIIAPTPAMAQSTIPAELKCCQYTCENGPVNLCGPGIACNKPRGCITKFEGVVTDCSTCR
jgi:hypothetical protein